jgi:hypothetical protein
MLKKHIWANFQRIVEVFTQKMFNMLSDIWVWDPGSEIRDPRSEIRDPGSEIRDPGSGKNLFRIPDLGVKKAPDPGSRIHIRNTGAKFGICTVVSLKGTLFEAKYALGTLECAYCQKSEPEP